MTKSVEFVGLPGSGKSSLFGIVKAYLRENEFIVSDSANSHMSRELAVRYLEKKKGERLRRLGIRGSLHYLCQWISGYFKVAAQSVALRSFLYDRTDLVGKILTANADRAIPRWEREHILERYFEAMVHYELVTALENERHVIMTDPGFVQRGIALFGYGRLSVDEEKFGSFVGVVPRPDLLISVEVSPKTATERLRTRGFPRRLEGMELDVIQQSLTQTANCIDIARNVLEKRGTVSLVIDNECPLDVALNVLQSELANLSL